MPVRKSCPEAVRQAFDALGGTSKAARQMGVVYVSAHQWVKGICELPILRAIQLEQLTNGQVRADQMRPDAADAMAYLRGQP